MNPLHALQDYGQSVWLDYFRRNLVTGGEPQALTDEDGLRGITSNPWIFEKAIGGSTDYDGALQALEQEQDLAAGKLYERLAVADLQMAADVLRPSTTRPGSATDSSASRSRPMSRGHPGGGRRPSLATQCETALAECS